MASITKLMTVLADARAREAERHGRRSAPAPQPSADRASTCAPGERLTVRDLVEAALIQSANDAAVALADYVGHGDRRALRHDDEPSARGSSACATRTSSARTASTRPATCSSARDLTLLGRVLMHKPFVRHDRRDARGDDRRRPAPAHLERPAGLVPRRDRRQDRPHGERGLVPGRGRARDGPDGLRHDPRRARRARSATTTSRRCCGGASRATGSRR